MIVNSKSLFISVCLLSLLLSTSFVHAQVHPETDQLRFYKAYVIIDEEGRSYVNLTMTFWEPETAFNMKVIGRVENFYATSNAGPVDCGIEITGVSDITCSMGLTEQKRELNINFETVDFVKALGDKILYFNAEVSPNVNTTSLTATVRLPKNHFLVGESTESSILSYPDKAFAHILGENILVTWELSEISETEGVTFEILYEEAEPPIWFQLRMRHFILFGAALAGVLGFIIIRHLRKSDEVVLSILDEYERQIMDIIAKEGEIKQKKIVDLSNFSKAKVSRVVKSLSERGLIEVERRGRTNRVKLSKKQIGFNKQ